jgi:alpha-glucosidase
MKYLPFFSLLALVVLISACPGWKAATFESKSPEGKVGVEFGLNEKGQPYYRAFYRDELVLDTSFLGFSLNKAQPLKEGFEVGSIHRSTFDETWEQPWGEEQFIRNHYNELRVCLQEKRDQKRKLDVVFRLYDDGLGFRYEFPEQENLRNFEVLDELTEFYMTADHAAWWIPAFEENRYEYLYRHTPLAEMGKVHTPVTFETEKGICISIHEAALEKYSSMVVDAAGSRRLRCELVPYSREEKSRAFVTAPGKTPWRTIQLAEKPGELVTSYLILNLNEPNQLGDVSWFEPGKYIGIWWEMHIGKGTWASGPKHSANTENTKKYIDFASRHGFDGVLVEGWNKGWDGDWVQNGEVFSFTEPYSDFDLKALGVYAKGKGVYLIGHHETAGNVDNYERQMADAFQLLEQNGVKAVKTGYVEHGNILSNGKYHHGQSYVDHFRKVIRLAAQHHIAVVAHEPIKDTGERRTFPNIISREGARGQEFNAWSDDGGNPPDHETILPFTRCLAGPMDFTPGVFDIRITGKPDNQVNTTLVKQLALYVTMYSPMQMACDLPEHYEKYPDAFAFIKEVGVDWETTRVPDAAIGQYLVVARKEKGTGNWFVGAITNEEPRAIDITLDFLEDGKTYQAVIYQDGKKAHYRENPEDYTIVRSNLTARDTLRAQLAAGGGLAVSFFVVEGKTLNGDF